MSLVKRYLNGDCAASGNLYRIACGAAVVWVAVSSLVGRAWGVERIEFDPSKSRTRMAVHPTTGEIYALDSDRMAIYDQSGVFLRELGAIQNLGFQRPNVQVNAQGRVLVAAQEIQLFDAIGNLETTIPRGSSSNPVALGADGRVFVAKPANDGPQIDIFTPQGTLERSWPLPDIGASRLFGFQMDLGPDGNLYIYSQRNTPTNQRSLGVEVLNPDGMLQRDISLGRPAVGFQGVQNQVLRIASNGNLLISPNPRHINVFDPLGKPIQTIYSGLSPTTDFDGMPGGGLAIREFGNGSRIRVFSAEEAAQLSPRRAVLHFQDGPFGWAGDPSGAQPFGGQPNVIAQKLELVGIGAGNQQSETTAEMFRVPGPAGVPQQVSVTWHPVIAGMDSFGIFDPTTIAIDPTVDPRGYAAAALRTGRVVFRKSDLRPIPNEQTPITKDLTLDGGATFGVFFTSVSSATYEQFLANPATARMPFLSVSAANLGGYDQMVAFAGNGRTLLGFEDLANGDPQFDSDNNFSDEMFSFNVQMIPVPEPATAVLAGIAAAVMAGVLYGRRRRRNLAG